MGRDYATHYPSPVHFAPMIAARPPTLDSTAAARWAAKAISASPWLHEEIGRRMAERLGWIKQVPKRWVSWAPVHGGLQTHALVVQRYPNAACNVVESSEALRDLAQRSLTKPWWQLGRWRGLPPQFDRPADGRANMVWANMSLHMAADPQACFKQWQALLGVDGFLMFSCLGPDTLRELREVYAALGWPAPAHAFTDMHDWGDMLVEAGFAEPVMDMERITLTYPSPQRLIEDLRSMGRNLNVARFSGLRGRAWRTRLDAALAIGLARPDHDGHLVLTFEVAYGHAFKPVPRPKLEGRMAVSLQDMRAMLQAGRPGIG